VISFARSGRRRGRKLSIKICELTDKSAEGCELLLLS